MYLEEVIAYSLDRYEVLMKKDGIILRNITKVAELCGVSRGSIYNWLETKNEGKFFAHGVELILAKKARGGYYICSDGEIRTTGFVPIKKIGRQKNLIRLTLNDKRMILRAANIIFKTFVDENHDIMNDKLLFLDGDLSNCAIENLQASKTN